MAINAPLIPVWDTGYTNGNIGGLLEAMLRPVGNFGKFLTVLLSLSVTGNIAASFYSISLNIQVFIPWLVIVPRYILSVLATAMYDFSLVIVLLLLFNGILFQCCIVSDRRLSQVL